MKKRDIVNLVILIIVISFAAYRFYHRKYNFAKSRFALDTIVEITFTTSNKDSNPLLDRAFDLIEEYEKKFSFFQKGSKLWNINHSEMDSVQIDKEFFEILKISEDLFYKSGSLYDVTIGSLSELWDFSNTHIPSRDSIEIAQHSIGFEKIRYSENYLFRPSETKLNFGSLAKGYIIDRVVDFLKDNLVESGIINAGGDMRIFGYEKPVRIGIQHPRAEQNEVIEILQAGNQAVVTSGDYERYFEIDGKRYHHILNPETGYPSENAISVTVIAPSAVIADAYSTALFLMKPEKAIEIADQNENMEVIVYYQNEDEIDNLKSKNFSRYLVEK